MANILREMMRGIGYMSPVTWVQLATGHPEAAKRSADVLGPAAAALLSAVGGGGFGGGRNLSEFGPGSAAQQEAMGLGGLYGQGMEGAGASWGQNITDFMKLSQLGGSPPGGGAAGRPAPMPPPPNILAMERPPIPLADSSEIDLDRLLRLAQAPDLLRGEAGVRQPEPTYDPYGGFSEGAMSGLDLAMLVRRLQALRGNRAA